MRSEAGLPLLIGAQIAALELIKPDLAREDAVFDQCRRIRPATTIHPVDLMTTGQGIN